MTYVSTVSADSPDHWWRLADPGGIIGNDIGTLATKVPVFIDTFGVMPYTGMTSDGLCAAHTASTNIQVVESVIALTNTWSLEAWAWMFYPGGNDSGILGMQIGVGARLAIRFEAAGTILGFTTTGSLSARDAALFPTLRAWHHYVLTYDHVTLRLYVDGAAHGTAAGVVTTTGSYRLTIGDECPPGTDRASGFFEDVAIYPTTLTPTQILAHYNAADQKSSKPVYQGGGTFTVGTGSTDPLNADTQAILASVRKTYVSP